MDKVVWSSKFNPDAMANDARRRLSIKFDDRSWHFALAIDHYRAAAWAVKGFIERAKLT